MKHQRHTIKQLLAGILTLTMLALFAGCNLGDPVVNVGSPSPLARASMDAVETTAPNTPAPTPTNTPLETAAQSTEEPAEANGSGAYTITTDTSESQKTYYSEHADENALRVENAAVVNIDGAAIEKRSGDASSLTDTLSYGLNAAVLVRAGGKLTLLNSEVTSSALGASGAVAHAGTLGLEGGGVRTTGDSSLGIAATVGGSITTRETNISTQGATSPAIRTSPGGTISIEGGMAVTGGENSPVLDASGTITATNATLRGSDAAAVAVNAGGSVTLTDCAASGRMGDVFSADTLIAPYCVALYRGADADGDTSSFSMTRGALSAQKGDLFYATNTNASIYLEGVALSLGKEQLLLRASGNDGALGWGEAGKNGASCKLVANGQTLTGDIVADELSSVAVTLKGDSTYTGTINTANTALAAKMTLEDGSTWTLTGNAYLTAFSGRVSSIVTNGFTVYVNGAVLAS